MTVIFRVCLPGFSLANCSFSFSVFPALFLVPRTSGGGAEKVITSLASKLAEKTDNTEAMFQQGLVELYGVSGDPNVKKAPNFESAMRWFRLAAFRKHAGANYEVSTVLARYPNMVKPLSPYEQEDCMRAAYNGGDPLAKACVEQLFNEAKRLAAQGNPDAKWHLFLALSEGQGCPKDPEAAKRLLAQLKAEKNPHCMSYLANKGRRASGAGRRK